MKRLLDGVFDNPILVKHLRSRLRLGQALPWVALVVVFSACIAWAGHDGRFLNDRTAVVLLLGIQILSLAFGGSNQINTSLGGARETGILAFHRVSPLSPGVVALGFFLGAPIREYLMAAVTLPFAVFNAALSDLIEPRNGLIWLAQLELEMLLSIWTVHALAMLGCLTRKKPRGSIQGMVVTVLGLLVLGSSGSIGFFVGAQWLLDETLRLNFFGKMIPWLPWLLLYELPLLGFLGLAVARKMRAERAHAFTKRQSLACMATVTGLTLGGLWRIARVLPETYPSGPLTVADTIMLAAVYGLSLAAMILAVTITPGAGEYIRGVRRALREGQRRPSALSDAGSNRVALFALAALVLIGASAVVRVVGRPPIGMSQPSWMTPAPPIDKVLLSDAEWLESREAIMSRPILIGVLTVAYVGLAFQYFSLRTRTSGMVLTALFLFVAWLFPPMIAAFIGMGTTPNEKLALAILALSPLPGIALSTGLTETLKSGTIQFAALAPAITFTFLFKYLLVNTQRKLDRALREADKAPTPLAPHEAPGKWRRNPTWISRASEAPRYQGFRRRRGGRSSVRIQVSSRSGAIEVVEQGGSFDEWQERG